MRCITQDDVMHLPKGPENKIVSEVQCVHILIHAHALVCAFVYTFVPGPLDNI